MYLTHGGPGMEQRSAAERMQEAMQLEWGLKTQFRKLAGRGD